MRRSDCHGFALMAVLWILVIVGAVGITFQAGARAERRVVVNARSALRARWAAHAGLHFTLQSLDSTIQRGGAGGPFRTGNDRVMSPIDFQLDGVSVYALALDARARLNLNLADDLQLRRLFVALGLDPPHSHALAAAVLDWRDFDRLRRPDGAEAAEYGALRPPSRPKNAPFDAVEELQTVFGMTPALYARVAPYVTVAGDGRINVNSASFPVLATLEGIDVRTAEVIVVRRRQLPFRNVFEMAAALPPEAQDIVQSDFGAFTDRVEFGPRALEIMVTASVEGTTVGSNLLARVELAGGTVWSVTSVVER